MSSIAVFGAWHLGCVTAACLAADGNDVVVFDPDPEVSAGLASGDLPIYEPGLAELFQRGLDSGKLGVSETVENLVANATLVWITFDTPVDDEDKADVDAVLQSVRSLFPHLCSGMVVLVSSQLPAGSVGKLEREFSEAHPGIKIEWACSPENLRLGEAISTFRNQERLIVGCRSDLARSLLTPLLSPYAEKILWVGVESAEMTKHALNSFLAACVVFANELATICEQVGANAREVEAGLRSEPRVGEKAYIRPGPAFAGGTLARDVSFLVEFSQSHGLSTPMFQSLLASNEAHRWWDRRNLERDLGDLKGSVIAVLGLTYKPGTNTLRRSPAIELCRWLLEQQAEVRCFDPAVNHLPEEMSKLLKMAPDAVSALRGADAVVIATPWPDFKDIAPDTFIDTMRTPQVLDAFGILTDKLADRSEISYRTIGRAW